MRPEKLGGPYGSWRTKEQYDLDKLLEHELYNSGPTADGRPSAICECDIPMLPEMPGDRLFEECNVCGQAIARPMSVSSAYAMDVIVKIRDRGYMTRAYEVSWLQKEVPRPNDFLIWQISFKKTTDPSYEVRKSGPFAQAVTKAAKRVIMQEKARAAAAKGGGK